MNLENSIKDVISKKIEDGIIEKLISEQLEKGINNALENMFRSYGDITKLIEEKIKSVMVPYLENYNYSEYIIKLDAVLTEILKSVALDNKKILENFKELVDYKKIDEIKVSEIFEVWADYVAEKINTSNLEVTYDDGVSYEYADVSLEVVYEEERSWSNVKYATIVLECEKDEEMNVEIRISNYNDRGWKLETNSIYDIRSLRRLDEFSIFLSL